MTVKRLATAAPIEPARPFYELDEEAPEVAAESAEPIMPPLLTNAPKPPPVLPPVEVPPVPLKQHRSPSRFARPESSGAPAPEAPPARCRPEAPDAAQRTGARRGNPRRRKAPLGRAAVPEERMIRYRTLGSNDVALLDRLFATEAPSIIAHFIMISSIACTEPGSGEDTSGYALFLRRDIELLGRALVHSRMGKAPQYRIAQGDLDGLSLTWDDAPQQAFPPQRRLRRDLRKPELAAIGKLMQSSERDASLRTRIALLALAGTTLDGTEKRAAEECAAALRELPFAGAGVARPAVRRFGRSRSIRRSRTRRRQSTTPAASSSPHSRPQ